MPRHYDRSMDEYRDVCFVIMPFGVKTVGTGDDAREVNFDPIYDSLFEPAIRAATSGSRPSMGGRGPPFRPAT